MYYADKKPLGFKEGRLEALSRSIYFYSTALKTICLNFQPV